MSFQKRISWVCANWLHCSHTEIFKYLHWKPFLWHFIIDSVSMCQLQYGDTSAFRHQGSTSLTSAFLSVMGLLPGSWSFNNVCNILQAPQNRTEVIVFKKFPIIKLNSLKNPLVLVFTWQQPTNERCTCVIHFYLELNLSLFAVIWAIILSG